MAETDNKTGGNGGSSSSASSGGSGSSSGGGGGEPIDPKEAPVSASTATGNASGSNASGRKQERSLGDETSKVQEKDALAGILDKVKEAMGLVAEFNLRPESLVEVANGITGPVMAGVKVTKDMIENVVKKVDPLEYAATKFREAVGPTMAQVDNSRSGLLASQSVGQQQERGASLQVNS